MTSRAGRSPFVAAALALAVAGHGVQGFAAGMTDAQAKSFMNAAGCNGCHAVDEIRIGPRLRDVARRYHTERDAALPRLVTKIRAGGAGAWGLVPMVANPCIAPDDARAIAAWILALPVSEAQQR
ncbi:MAG: hypothetical protein IT493_06575, partial [Gammaproteobacteria bacterium]|nr:hypothetical protein [Gammaproteobacteria bacterium]